mgnify:CR=1 FL=1
MRQSVGEFAHRLPLNVLRYRALCDTPLVPLFLCDLHYHRNEVVGAAVVPEVDDEGLVLVCPAFELAVDTILEAKNIVLDKDYTEAGIQILRKIRKNVVIHHMKLWNDSFESIKKGIIKYFKV